jgi:hypothetical protein
MTKKTKRFGFIRRFFSSIIVAFSFRIGSSSASSFNFRSLSLPKDGFVTRSKTEASKISVRKLKKSKTKKEIERKVQTEIEFKKNVQNLYAVIPFISPVKLIEGTIGSDLSIGGKITEIKTGEIIKKFITPLQVVKEKTVPFIKFGTFNKPFAERIVDWKDRKANGNLLGGTGKLMDFSTQQTQTNGTVKSPEIRKISRKLVKKIVILVALAASIFTLIQLNKGLRPFFWTDFLIDVLRAIHILLEKVLPLEYWEGLFMTVYKFLTKDIDHNSYSMRKNVRKRIAKKRRKNKNQKQP